MRFKSLEDQFLSAYVQFFKYFDELCSFCCIIKWLESRFLFISCYIVTVSFDFIGTFIKFLNCFRSSPKHLLAEQWLHCRRSIIFYAYFWLRYRYSHKLRGSRILFWKEVQANVVRIWCFHFIHVNPRYLSELRILCLNRVFCYLMTKVVLYNWGLSMASRNHFKLWRYLTLLLLLKKISDKLLPIWQILSGLFVIRIIKGWMRGCIRWFLPTILKIYNGWTLIRGRFVLWCNRLDCLNNLLFFIIILPCFC